MHILHVINSRITAKFGTKVAHDKPILLAKQNSEISIDVIMLKF